MSATRLTSGWQTRPLKELERLLRAGHRISPDAPSEEGQIFALEDITDLRSFLCEFKGPVGTPYEGGTWHVRFTLPEHYPFQSPSVGFVENIFHPNVDFASGSICLDTLSHKAWQPTFWLINIIEGQLPLLLSEPNPRDPLNHTAAELLLKDPEGYKKVAREFAIKHARAPAAE
jgi:ubiquitin-conjugating enzyme E2 H